MPILVWACIRYNLTELTCSPKREYGTENNEHSIHYLVYNTKDHS